MSVNDWPGTESHIAFFNLDIDLKSAYLRVHDQVSGSLRYICTRTLRVLRENRRPIYADEDHPGALDDLDLR